MAGCCGAEQPGIASWASSVLHIVARARVERSRNTVLELRRRLYSVVIRRYLLVWASQRQRTALFTSVLTVTVITNKSLRALITVEKVLTPQITPASVAIDPRTSGLVAADGSG